MSSRTLAPGQERPLNGQPWPLVITISVALMALLLIAGVEGPVRVIVGLWFFCVCPGMAFVPLFPFRTTEAALAMGVVVSLVCSTLIATMIVAIGGGLTQTSGFIALAALCLLGSALQVAKDQQDPVLT